MAGGTGLITIDGRDYTPTVEMPYDERVDASDPFNVIIGRAFPGTLTSDPLWQIRKETVVAGVNNRVVSSTVLYVGLGEFDQIWDNRATLHYGP